MPRRKPAASPATDAPIALPPFVPPRAALPGNAEDLNNRGSLIGRCRRIAKEIEMGDVACRYWNARNPEAEPLTMGDDLTAWAQAFREWERTDEQAMTMRGSLA